MSQTARISWISEDKGGRRAPPPLASGSRYVGVAKFELQEDLSECGEWSLVVEPVLRNSQPTEWVASVRFLFADGPQHWLRAGIRFALYEGRRQVALGTVLASVPEPAGATDIPAPVKTSNLAG